MKQEAQPARWCLFLSIFHLFLFSILTWKSHIQNLHFIGPTAHCFLPPVSRLLPPTFSCKFSKVLSPKQGFVADEPTEGIFSEKSPLPTSFCKWPHMLTRASVLWITAERDVDPWFLCKAVTQSWWNNVKENSIEIFLLNVAVFVLLWRNSWWILVHASVKSAVNLQRAL